MPLISPSVGKDGNGFSGKNVDIDLRCRFIFDLL
jgi:hypothetical protein